MTNKLTTIDATQLSHVTGGEGPGPAQQMGERIGNTLGGPIGTWLGSKVGYPTWGGVVGQAVGGFGGKAIGAGIDYVNARPDVRSAAEAAPQGA